MEFIYVYTNGDMSRMEEVLKIKAHQFMFVVEFLTDKAKVEANRNKLIK